MLVDRNLRLRQFEKALGVTFLALTIALVVSSMTNAYAIQPFPITFPLNNFDFSLTASTTLVQMQQGQTGGLRIWVDLYCPNSTATIRCDTTQMQTIYLSLSGCPSGAFCSLDRQELEIPPITEGASDVIIHTFFGISTGSSPVLMTVTGVDQFGHVHSVSFGTIVCYC